MTARRTMLSVGELAERWGVDVKTIREAIELGQLPAVAVGRRRKLVPIAAIERMEQGRDMPGGE